MTEPHETPDEYEEAADRWLSAQHRHLVDHLDATLDIEAGLQDILLHSQHAALVERLDTEIDIESNLAAILSPEKNPIGPKAESLIARQPSDTSAFAAMPAAKRIALRTEPAVMRAYLQFIIGVVIDLDLRLTRALGYPGLDPIILRASLDSRALAHVRDRARDFKLALEIDPEEVRAHGLSYVDTMADAIGLSGFRAHRLVRALERDGDLVCGLVHALVLDLDRAVDLALALGDSWGYSIEIDIDRARVRDFNDVGKYINRCRQAIEDALGCHLPGANAEVVAAFLDDFTDADLRGAELNKVDLTGVRWSESGTRWPPGVDIKAIKQRSTSQGNGIWVVGRGGGLATVPDSVGVS